MKNFAYYTAESVPAAARALAGMKNAVAKGGGTDLLALLKDRVLEPDEVVSLKGAKIDAKVAGVIAATTTLAELAADPWIKKHAPAVHVAADEAATPQIRNVATVGGNLCQSTRCWYYRNKNFACSKRGDDACAALTARSQHRYHAVFPHVACASAHASNLAPALIAVAATVHCVHPDGDRALDAGLLYQDPAKGRVQDTILRPGELIERITVPDSPLARRSTYVEFRERESFDFSAVSVAAAVHIDGGKVIDARIVLGAVAPKPLRATAAEQALVGQPLNAATIEKAAAAAFADARPLSDNKYKVVIGRRLVMRALAGLKEMR